jgi:hypothetical protein
MTQIKSDPRIHIRPKPVSAKAPAPEKKAAPKKAAAPKSKK